MNEVWRLKWHPIPLKISSVHHMDCPLHDNELITPTCGALGFTCPRKSTIFEPHLLPVCREHKNEIIAASRCRAIMSCGYHCDRVCKATPPFSFCHEHVQRTTVRPCYLMKLTIELRFRIFKLLLPDVISASPSVEEPRASLRSYCSLLLLNREIHEEAKTVLYEQIPFEIKISHDKVSFCAQTFEFGQDGTSHFMDAVADMLPVIKKIRNIRTEICINTWPEDNQFYGILNPKTTKGNEQVILPEDYGLLALRDSLRLFIRALRPFYTSSANPEIITLEVNVTDKGLIAWSADETIAAVALATEPLKQFGPVQKPHLRGITIPSTYGRGLQTKRFTKKYNNYKAEWQNLMTQAYPQRALEPYANYKWFVDKGLARYKLQKIKEFISMTKTHKHFFHCLVTRRSPSFDGMHRVLYLARLAHEQNDIDGLDLIREAFTERWIDFHRIQQRDARLIANSIMDMYPEDQQAVLAQTHTAELVFTPKPPSVKDFDPSWPELNVVDFKYYPKSRGRAKFVAEDRLREYYKMKGGGAVPGEDTVVAVLKTPSFIRRTLGT